MAKINVRLKRSMIGTSPKQKKIVKALGFGKTNHVKTFDDNITIKGAIAKAPHLFEVSEVK
jgi:large subunit ribosomal protein L30